MRTFTIVYAFSAVFLSQNSALASCLLEGFDSTPPRALSGDVSNSGSNFRWASDLDERDGRNYVWHYIQNIDKYGSLNFDWAKAGLRHEFARPLPPGEAACNLYPVVKIDANDIDDDAPIVYGNNNSVQRAAVFKKIQSGTEKAQKFTSKISSAYLDDEGVKQDLEVSFFYEVADGMVLSIGISAPNNYYVGIANAAHFWSENTIGDLAYAAKKNSVEFEFLPLPVFSDDTVDASSFFEGWASYDVPGAIFGGGIYEFSENSTDGSTELTEMVVFDSSRRPIASGLITIPVTSKRP